MSARFGVMYRYRGVAAKMTTHEICMFFQKYVFQLNEKILEIWLFRYLMELHSEILQTLPGGNLEKFLYRMWLHNFTTCLQTQQHEYDWS